MKNLLLLLSLLLVSVESFPKYEILEPQIAIGDVLKPEEGTAFAVQSTSLTSLPCPKMTEAQRDALNPIPTASCVYNTTSAATQFYNGADWVDAGSQSILTEWTTGVGYGIGSFVYTTPDYKLWIANTAHTAGATFAGDIANWDEASDDLNRLTSSTDNALPRFDGVTGDLIQDSGVLIDDTNNMTGVVDITSTGNISATGSIHTDTFLQIKESSVCTPSASSLCLYTDLENGIPRFRSVDSTGFEVGLDEDIYIRVRNDTGSTITKGSAVYISGSTGSTPNIALARANAQATMPAVGLAMEEITNNGFGRVLKGGLLEAIDTSAFTEGNVVYVSDTVAGGLTTTKPLHPNLQQTIGVVTNSGVGNGSISVTRANNNGNESGTIENIFNIGSGTAGEKSLEFENGFTYSLNFNPTANRSLTFPDSAGASNDTLITDGAGNLSWGRTTTNLTTEVTGVLPIANGGTGSATQNFVDLTTAQSVGGIKTFTDEPVFSSGIDVNGTSNFSALTTFNGQYVAISTTNGNRPCPVMTEAQRDAIATPSSGDCVVNSNTNEVNFYLDSAWTLIGGGGAGGSRLNLPEHPSFERETEGTCTTCSLSLDTVNVLSTSNNESSLKIEVSDALFSGGFGLCASYVLDVSTDSQWHEGLPIIKYFYIKIPEANKATYEFISRKNGSDATEDFLISPMSNNGKWTDYKLQALSGTTSNGYKIKICNNTGSALPATESVHVDEVEIRPTNSSDYSEVSVSDTDWVSYTPTTQGLGTITLEFARYKRVGDTMLVWTQFTTGTPTAEEAQFSLPLGANVSSRVTNISRVGYLEQDGNAEGFYGVLATAGDNFLNFGWRGTSTSGAFTAKTGNATFASSRKQSFLVTVPIEGWSTGRVNAFSQRRDFPVVEAAGNGGQTITANVTNIDFTEVKDDFGLWSDSDASGHADTFTADRDGYWLVSGAVLNTTDASNLVQVYKKPVGGSFSVLKSITPNDLNNNLKSFTTVVSLSKDEQISLRANLGITLNNSIVNHHLHIQYFPTFADVIAQLSTDQIKGACFNTTYSETEIECGMRNGEMVYRRCFTVTGSTLTSTTTLATWDTGLTPINAVKTSATTYYIPSLSFTRAASDQANLTYNSDTGVLEYVINSRDVFADTSGCVDYFK